MAIQTEFEFTLPRGYLDKQGALQRHGIMRLATVVDEILPYNDPRVRKSPDYLKILLLARVITKLGNIEAISPRTIEELFVGDLVYLEDLYNRINGKSIAGVRIMCPRCSQTFEIMSNSYMEEA